MPGRAIDEVQGRTDDHCHAAQRSGVRAEPRSHRTDRGDARHRHPLSSAARTTSSSRAWTRSSRGCANRRRRSSPCRTSSNNARPARPNLRVVPERRAGDEWQRKKDSARRRRRRRRGEEEGQSKKKLIIMIVPLLVLIALRRREDDRAEAAAAHRGPGRGQGRRRPSSTLDDQVRARERPEAAEAPPAEPGDEGHGQDRRTTTTTTIAPDEAPAGPVLELDSKTMNLDGTPLPEDRPRAAAAGRSRCPTTSRRRRTGKRGAASSVIDTFSGQTLDELSTDEPPRAAAARDRRRGLPARPTARSLTVYFTDFVMQ